MDVEKQTIIIWTNETDNIDNILCRLRESGAKVYMATFPELRKSTIFIGNNVYTLEQMNEILKGE